MNITAAQFIIVFSACCLCTAADEVAKPTAKDSASAFFEAYITGDAETAGEMSAIPFLFDGEQTFTMRTELDLKLKDFLAKQARAEVPKYTTSAPENPKQLDPLLFPAHAVIRITIAGEDKHIDIYVSAADDPKILGFSR